MRITKENNNIIIKDASDFSVAQTLECGQCFHFVKLNEDDYVLSAYGKMLHITQNGDEIILHDTSRKDFDDIWYNYFDLGNDYGEIKRQLLEKDDKLKEAIETMWGVRILKQEFFETLISFIISQNKQIPHIKKIVADISRTKGKLLGEVNGVSVYAFPPAEEIKDITEEELKELKTGFRAPYIMDAIKKINSGEVSEAALSQMNNEEVMSSLCSIKGVGEKIGNCVMLFGLCRRDAFPIDVWIKRIMEYLYFGKETKKEDIRDFAAKQFGELGGYAQQYLFYYGRDKKLGV